MKLSPDALDALMPMHMSMSADGRVRHVGPTLLKLMHHVCCEGRYFADVLEVYRPKRAETVPMLLDLAGRPVADTVALSPEGHVQGACGA